MTSSPVPAQGPLAGVRVLDLTSVIMGPFATQILAQLGADVLKIETSEGDTIRQVGPMPGAGMGPMFLQANQGKRSAVLDLKSAGGHEALLELAASHDVFISNIRPQALARLGLDYEAVRARNPRIIYVNCCGFDQTGPYAARPAYDDLIQGAAGLPWLIQQAGAAQPEYTPLTLGDRVAGLHAVYAVTAALYARSQTNEGQEIVVPMFEAMTQFVFGDHLGGLLFEPPAGGPGYARLLSPYRRPYQTSDGYLCVLIYNDKHWTSFFASIDKPDRMAHDPRFRSFASRTDNIDALYEEVSTIMKTRTTEAWRILLDAADIPNMPMNSLQDLLDDEHLRATGFIYETEHPTEGRIYATRNPVRWSGTPTSDALRPAPLLGEHTADVLRELGYSEGAVASHAPPSITDV
jgi:crotonobetainyl-CoA:carnitine CoA-transferase CaiB-like acyl-CoA transferase